MRLRRALFLAVDAQVNVQRGTSFGPLLDTFAVNCTGRLMPTVVGLMSIRSIEMLDAESSGVRG